MLEGRFIVSRMFPGSCQSDGDWGCMSFRFEVDLDNGKRPLDADGNDDPPRRKSRKQSEARGGEGDNMSGSDGLEEDAHEAVPGMEERLPEPCKEGYRLEDEPGEMSRVSGCEDSNNQRFAGDSSNSDSLINALGRDNTINCLVRCSRSDYGSIALLNRSFRSLVNSGELYKLRRRGGIVEHWIYFSCHLLEWDAFDPYRRRWMHLPRMSSNESAIYPDRESLAVGTELHVFSKYTTCRYSLLANSWSGPNPMYSPRCLFGSASLREIAILAGGQDPQNTILSSAIMYNSETQRWEDLPNMHKPRKMCSAVFMDEKFYVLGGVSGSDLKPLTCGEEFDLKTRVWTEIPDMSPGRNMGGMPATAEAPPLVAVVNNELYAANYADMEVRKYDKARRVWSSIGRLPERADSMYGWGLAFRACGDSLIVIGGPSTHNESYIELNAWVPREGKLPEWRVLGQKRSSNFVYNCAVMGC
ncbi:hypothetical protein MLD38_004305 [Melastoma candidum]|uniref:Uncharacterized protein n=1 Tax=Melastoma candidum TaxID=119954 RepID=A0ACB9S5E5_9MYRT|nr:hypothetical protein MLD38_004305 [Melastoma candidum]